MQARSWLFRCACALAAAHLVLPATAHALPFKGLSWSDSATRTAIVLDRERARPASGLSLPSPSIGSRADAALLAEPRAEFVGTTPHFRGSLSVLN